MKNEETKAIKYELHLSVEAVERIAMIAGTRSVSVTDLLESFIGNLIGISCSTDEYLCATKWLDKHYPSNKVKKSLISYACHDMEHKAVANELFDIFQSKDLYEKQISICEENIEKSDERWKEFEQCVPLEDGSSRLVKASSVEEYIHNEQKDLDGNKEELELLAVRLEKIHKQYERYMDGEDYDWTKEVQMAQKWYKENIDDKYNYFILDESTKLFDDIMLEFMEEQ